MIGVGESPAPWRYRSQVTPDEASQCTYLPAGQKGVLSTMPTLQGPGASTPSLTLDVTPEMLTTLEELARDSRQPLATVFTRAIALYQAALKASAEGKHVGYADSPDSLDVEFTGLAGPGGR